ncbi:MAG: FecR domain-containing protein [Polyangiales bacterium]
MTRKPCNRRWEIEALEGGRLVGKDRASFERHVETCEDCTRAVARKHELGTLLAAIPTPEPTELQRRRLRAELLGRANERVVKGERSWRAAFVLVPAAFALVLLIAIRWRNPHAVPATQAPVFEVANLDHAEYTTERTDSISRVSLRAGTASFHVEHVKPGARFVVTVPDGEVEVRGTRFVVEVAGGRTRSVSVTEGVVAVRVLGFDGLLRAGERWPQIAAAQTPTPAPVPSIEPSASAIASTSATIVLSPAPALPGPRFGKAMNAFNAGDYGEADRLFVDFIRAFPSDTRVEDAMFLLADARARRGDKAGAREAARAYLHRFPNGLRAPAAERLAQPESK